MMMVLVPFGPTRTGCSSTISILDVEDSLFILDSLRLPSLLRTDSSHHFAVVRFE